MKLSDKDIKRFWSKVSIKSKDECWEWQASTSNGRYGKFKLSGKWISTHRLSYIITHGVIENNLQIQHHCDNVRCVNPNHLYAGTPKQNMADRQQRNPVSANKFANGKAKFYSGEIWLIRKLKGIKSSRYVGKMFKTSQMTIIRIWNESVYLCKEGGYI